MPEEKLPRLSPCEEIQLNYTKSITWHVKMACLIQLRGFSVHYLVGFQLSTAKLEFKQCLRDIMQTDLSVRAGAKTAFWYAMIDVHCGL